MNDPGPVGRTRDEVPLESANAAVVDFPLRGEGWVAVNSPGDRIPSHGTDMLGQRYAFDFLRVDERSGSHYHPASWLRTLLIGVPTHECYAWGAPVHAPLDGEVIRAVDGVDERSRIHPIREAFLAVRNGLTFVPARIPAILGNHMIMRSGDVYAVFAHLAPGSVTMRDGQAVRTGEVIGRVGHTGNSTTPHLHFQLMDSIDPMLARGVPCAFRSYEVLRGDGWEQVRNAVPRKGDRIRVIEPELDGPPAAQA